MKLNYMYLHILVTFSESEIKASVKKAAEGQSDQQETSQQLIPSDDVMVGSEHILKTDPSG